MTIYGSIIEILDSKRALAKFDEDVDLSGLGRKVYTVCQVINRPEKSTLYIPKGNVKVTMSQADDVYLVESYEVLEESGHTLLSPLSFGSTTIKSKRQSATMEVPNGYEGLPGFTSNVKIGDVLV